MAAKDYINLEMPSILGMGAVGPTLAVLTASVYQALSTIGTPPAWVYPFLMFLMSFIMAVFPVGKAALPTWQKFCLWPLASVVIFSAAWGTNNGLSAGGDALSGKEVTLELPSLVSSAYAGGETAVAKGPLTNQVDFSALVEFKKVDMPQAYFPNYPKTVWGVSWPEKGEVILKEKDGKWAMYVKEPQAKAQSPVQSPLRGGFFKRY